MQQEVSKYDQKIPHSHTADQPKKITIPPQTMGSTLTTRYKVKHS